MLRQIRPTTLQQFHLTALARAKESAMTQLSNLSNWIDPNPEEESNEFFFPILLKYEDREESEVVKNASDIRSGIGFKILGTKVKVQ